MKKRFYRYQSKVDLLQQDIQRLESRAQSKSEELYKKMERNKLEKQEMHVRLMQTQAEFEDYKRRWSCQKAELIQSGVQKLALELVPIVENFQRAFEEVKGAQEMKMIKEGVELVIKQFEDLLKKSKVRTFNSVQAPGNLNHLESLSRKKHEENIRNRSYLKKLLLENFGILISL